MPSVTILIRGSWLGSSSPQSWLLFAFSFILSFPRSILYFHFDGLASSKKQVAVLGNNSFGETNEFHSQLSSWVWVWNEMR